MPNTVQQFSLPQRLSSAMILIGLAVIGAGTFSGCQSAPAEPEQPTPDADLVAGLVAKGDQAAAIDHWDYPEANSALDYYQRALALDPQNLPARRGLERVMERYLQQARSAADLQNHARARSMLARARLVDPNHPGVAPTQAYLELLRDSTRHELVIDRTALAQRQQHLAGELRALGARARSADCRTLVTAGNDPDYRWIYQSMARAAGSVRIRAQFEVGAPSRVTVLCKP